MSKPTIRSQISAQVQRLNEAEANLQQQLTPSQQERMARLRVWTVIAIGVFLGFRQTGSRSNNSPSLFAASLSSVLTAWAKRID